MNIMLGLLPAEAASSSSESDDDDEDEKSAPETPKRGRGRPPKHRLPQDDIRNVKIAKTSDSVRLRKFWGSTLNPSFRLSCRCGNGFNVR